MASEKARWQEWKEDIYSFPDIELFTPDKCWEAFEYLKPLREQCLGFVLKTERRAVSWLAKEIRCDAMQMAEILNDIRLGKVMYCQHHHRKRNGSLRIIHEPRPDLKKVQEKICRNLLSDLPIEDCVHGFSGGSVVKALSPHLEAESFFTFDIVDAFPSVNRRMILKALGPFRKPTRGENYRIYYKRERGFFSWTVSKIICDFCLLNDALPQGAPTSPRLFDIVFQDLDESYRSFLSHQGLVYSRYADNIFISNLRGDIQGRFTREVFLRVENFGFEWHKFKHYKHCHEAIRSLGLNIIQGELHNTRQFKRRLRLLVRHVKWLHDHSHDYDKEFEQLVGMNGFAVKRTLNSELVAELEFILKNF